MRLLHITDLHGNRRHLDWVLDVASSYDHIACSGDVLGEGFDEKQFLAWAQKLSGTFSFSPGNHDETLSPCPLGAHVEVMGWSIEAADPFAGPLRFGPTTIAVYHYPPEGSPVAGDEGEALLALALRRGFGPAILLCGHIHNPSSWHDVVGRTVVFNPGKGDDSVPLPRHIVIDTKGGFAEFRDHSGLLDRLSLFTGNHETRRPVSARNR